MTPADFTARHGRDWERLESLLGGKADGEAEAGFPALYRRVCQHLALAQERRYPQELVDRLNALALAGQQKLYRPQQRFRTTVRDFLTAGFAQRVRARPGLLALTALLFYGTFAAGITSTLLAPELIYSLMSPAEVANFESMYERDGKVIGYQRGNDDNLAMFGYYIWNNIGIGFRTFAAGIFLGIGSLLLVGVNGLMIGMIAGYLTARGYGDTFWQFVCGHGAFELNAIVLCGMTGLMLGRAVLAPGRRTRPDALVVAGREAVPILYGAAAMLFVAAVIEAFWSSRTWVPAEVKYVFAAVCWLLVIVYFARAGRGVPVEAGRHAS